MKQETLDFELLVTAVINDVEVAGQELETPAEHMYLTQEEIDLIFETHLSRAA